MSLSQDLFTHSLFRILNKTTNLSTLNAKEGDKQENVFDQKKKQENVWNIATTSSTPSSNV